MRGVNSPWRHQLWEPVRGKLGGTKSSRRSSGRGRSRFQRIAKILHLLPQEFILDDQPGVHDPLGMMAARLEVRVHW